MTVLINSLVNAPHGKYEINKTIKIVDFFKVYSWSVYSLGILDGSPNLTLLSLNRPGHPTHSLYNRPHPLSIYIYTHPDSVPGSSWRHVSFYRLVRVLNISRGKFALISIRRFCIKKYVKPQLPLDAWCAEGGRWAVWGVPRSVTSAAGSHFLVGCLLYIYNNIAMPPPCLTHTEHPISHPPTLI